MGILGKITAQIGGIVLTICCLFLAACSQDRQGALIVQADAPQGTADGGGGNTFKGRPLNSYIVPLESVKAYKELIRPKLALLTGSPLRLIQTRVDKAWYFIPGQLSLLPAEKIGSHVSTDQVGRQDFESVWINSELFESMSIADQADLIMQEIFEGIRLLEFDSSYAKCMSTAAKSFLCDADAVYDKNRKGKPGSLTAEDYADLRKAAQEFMLRREPWTELLVEDLLARHNFRIGIRNFYRLEDEIKLSAVEATELLMLSLDNVKSFAKGTEPGDLSFRTESCKVQLSAESGSSEASVFEIRITKADGEEIAQSFKIGEIHTRRDKDFGSVYFKVHTQSLAPQARGEGDKSTMIQLVFDAGSNLIGVESNELIHHTRPDGSLHGRGIRGRGYRCGL